MRGVDRGAGIELARDGSEVSFFGGSKNTPMEFDGKTERKRRKKGKRVKKERGR